MYQASATFFSWCSYRRAAIFFQFVTISLLIFMMTNAYAASVILEWDKNTDTRVVGYKIYYKNGISGAPYDGAGLDQGRTPITIAVADLSNPDNPEFLLSGLQAGRTYYFAATAYDADGNESDYSNEVMFEGVEDTVKPELPAGFSASVLSSSNVFLVWNAAVDGGGSGIAAYDIYRDGQLIKSTSDLGITDAGLDADTEYRYGIKARDNAGNVSDLSNEILVKTFVESSTTIRVNCGGGNYIDAGGRQWQADFGFNTGNSSSHNDPIHRTEDDALHQKSRWDPGDATELAYDFNVPNGNYRVNLHFSESYDPASVIGARIFSVAIEGEKVLDHIDLFAEAGHDTALIKSFDTIVTDGNLTIDFQHEEIEDPKINAIEILSKDDLVSHVITASAGDFGSIDPQGSLQVAHGTNQTFTIDADPNHQIANVLVDGKSIGAVPSYTFDSVDSNHTISAQFAVKTYTITSEAKEHGTIAPMGTTTVSSGGNQRYTITPEPGYHIGDVLVDGVSVGPVSTHDITDVKENHSISAVFAVNSYTVTVQAGKNGSITPSGKVEVTHGGSKTFLIAADSQYDISDVKINGQSKGAITSHTFTNVTQDQTITASFAAKIFQIVAKDSANGIISPAGVNTVSAGDTPTYTFTPDNNFVLSDVLVNGVSVGSNPTYTFGPIASAQEIEAVFERENQPPVADAGPDQTVEEGRKVKLSGYNSIDPDNGIASLLWEQISGPAVALSDDTSEEVSFMTPDVNSNGAALVFRLTVTDMAGLKAEDTCIVNVTWVNMPPNAETTPDITVAEGADVVLDGSSSSDPDDGIASYRWVQKSGTPVTLTHENSAKTGFTAPNVGPQGMALSFELTVTDQGGLQATAMTIINVSWINVQPVAEAGPNQTVREGTDVTLNGSNSYDADDGIVTYTWTQTDGPPVNLSDASAANPTFIAPNVGPEGAALTFKLTVTDKGGLKNQDTCAVNIGWENEAPLADAGTDMTVQAGVNVILDGSRSSDLDDGLVSYQWIQIAGPQVVLNDAGAVKAGFIAPDPGYGGTSLTFKLTVTDAGGLQSQDTAIINVSWENTPPAANAGIDQEINSGVQVVLNGTKSSDPDDGIVSYQWVQISGPPVTLSSPTEVAPSFTAPIVDQDGVILSFTLTVTDKGGLQNADTCAVKINRSIQADTTVPEIFIEQPVGNGVYETSETTLSISGTALDSVGVTQVTWSNSNGDGGIANGKENWSVTGINLAKGMNVITVTAVDAAGNNNRATLTVTRKEQKDTTAPELQISSPSRYGFYFTFRSQVDLRGTCTDNNQVKAVLWENSAGGSGKATGTGNWAVKALSLSKWFNAITVTAIDSAGNSSTLNLLIFRWPF